MRRGRLGVVQRVFVLLDLLSRGKRSIKEVSQLSGLPRPTVHRLLRTLVDLGYVSQEPSGDYVLTIRLFQVASRIMYGLDLRQAVRPRLEHLAAQTGETVILGILADGDVVFLDKVDPPRPQALAVVTRVGSRVPAHGASIGKVLLAHLTPENLAKVIDHRRLAQLTPRTICTADELRKQLAKVKADGYAVNNEEVHEGIASVAAPLADYTGEVIAGISVVGSTFSVRPEIFADLAEKVKQTAREISRALGARDRTVDEQV